MSNNAAHTKNDNHTDHHLAPLVGTETKASTKTTELIAYVAAVLAIAVTAFVVGDDGQGGGAEDPFGASEALRYITFLTIGYMLARGLAKSGSREHHDAR